MNYVAAVNKGSDGRPNFHARKACNYAEEAIQGCGNQLPGECFTQEQVDEKKDAEIANLLRSLESQIPNWDTSKCPAVTLSTEKAWSSRGLYMTTYEPIYETTNRPLRRTERPRQRRPMYTMSSARSTLPSSILTLPAILAGIVLKAV